MNRVTQFVSFTSIMSISMVCLAAMLLLLAQGTNHPLAVQVTFHYPPHTLTLKRLAWYPPWWWQQSLMEWELERCLTQWLVSSSLQSTGPLDPVWLRLSGGSLHLSKSQIKISQPRSVTAFALVKAIPHVILHLGLPSIFFFHGGVCALAALFAWRFVPETRGKTLSQLCSIYEAKKTKGEADNPSLWFRDWGKFSIYICLKG